jgi:hypothetical protein
MRKYIRPNRRPQLNCCDDLEFDDYLDDDHSSLQSETDNEGNTMNTSEVTNQEKILNISDQEQNTALDESIFQDVTNLNVSDQEQQNTALDDGTLEDLTVYDNMAVLTQTFTDTTDLQSELESFDQVFIENTDVLSKEDELSFILADKGEGKQEEQNSDPSYQDDWDLLTTIQNLKSSVSVNDSEWDAISSIQSVVTMDTLQSEGVRNMSYKDILAKKASISVVGNGVKRPKKQPQKHAEEMVSSSSVMIPIIEDNCHDAFADREGYKYSRGGKKKLMFRDKKPRKLKSVPKAVRKS